jgi:hypothetical protein
MPVMKRVLTVAAASAAVALVAPTAASARLTEIGSPTAQGKPSCPANPCLAVSRTTGFQVKGGRVSNPYVVPRPGYIVAFTLALGKPSTRQITFFNGNLGGPASARLTILRAYKRRANNYRFVVKGESEVFQLAPYFGMTPQFALARSLLVNKADLIALTVSTWAPVLAVGLDSATTWRASRPKPCSDSEAFQQTAQERLGTFAQYACEYKTARMTYSATLISTT